MLQKVTYATKGNILFSKRLNVILSLFRYVKKNMIQKVTN